VIFGSKLAINHPSEKKNKRKGWQLGFEKERRERERKKGVTELPLAFFYSLRFKMSVVLAKKNCFKMNAILHFQYNFNFFLPTLPSINTSTFFSLNFQCNFKFVFFILNNGSLVKVLCLMIISFHSLIYVQLTKATRNLKRRK